jgi:hypothetical protein
LGKETYYIHCALPTLAPIAHGFKIAMKLVAYGLDVTPPMIYGTFIAVHGYRRILTNVAALVKFI